MTTKSIVLFNLEEIVDLPLAKILDDILSDSNAFDQNNKNGKVDDLTISYSGNRISGVSDSAPPVTWNGRMDYPGVVNLLCTGMSKNNLIAKNRYNMGYDLGEKYTKSIFRNLTENETIKIISHSMGAAATKGLIEALLEYANENDIDPKIELELDLAPFQPNEQEANKEVPTYTVSHKYDNLAGLSDMKNAKNYHTRQDKADSTTKTEHGIASFKDEVVRLIKEGKIKTSVIY